MTPLERIVRQLVDDYRRKHVDHDVPDHVEADTLFLEQHFGPVPAMPTLAEIEAALPPKE